MSCIPADYQNWSWFHDIVKLLNDINLGWFFCSHDPLPSKRDKEAWEEIDLYFIDEMKLEAKGWRSISLGNFSDYELEVISALVANFPDHAYLSKITPGEDIFPIIGATPNPSTGLTLHPKVIDQFVEMLIGFQRPHIIVTTKDVSPIIDILPTNHRVIRGELATAISYDRVAPDVQREIVALHENNLRMKPMDGSY